MKLTWQNLNEKAGGRTGPILQNGRAWLRLGAYTIGWQWVLGDFRCHGYVAVRPDRESTLGASLAVPGAALYLHLDTPWGHRLDGVTRRPGARFGTDRQVGFSVHDQKVWWDVWADQAEWRHDDPRWRHGCFAPLDVLLGHAKYSTREIERRSVLIPMPEGSYPATAVLLEATWRRPRWPFPRRMMRLDFDLERGIPHAGKGENSWDCGDDATYGFGCSAATIEEGIGKLVASCLKDRRRFGAASNQKAPVYA